MIERIISTEGNVIGELKLLRDYWRAAAIGYKTTTHEKIIEVSANEGRPSHDNYYIGDGETITFLTLSKKFRPLVREVLGLSESEPLEGTPVKAYYLSDILEGFSKLEK
ncbi:MAG: hypothetical protein ABIG93_02050 [archaeon]|nr:hypothetical protein [Nanoarchaeota archaeon]